MLVPFAEAAYSFAGHYPQHAFVADDNAMGMTRSPIRERRLPGFIGGTICRSCAYRPKIIAPNINIAVPIQIITTAFFSEILGIFLIAG
jgi:hypothetical protein